MSKSKNIKIVVFCLVMAVIIVIMPLIFVESEFGGADGAASEAVGEINPDYVPWAEPILSPPGGETESLLFCLQAAIGSGVFCFGFGYLVARKKYSKDKQE